MNDNDDLTTHLSRTLEDQAHSMDGTSLGLADVQGRARSIRRRRTATAVVGAAAAVALIVPTAALATHQIDRSNEPLPATNSVSPTPSETTSADRQPAPGVLDVSDLATGPAPRMDYLDLRDGRLHATDGSVVAVRTQHVPRQFVELADGARVWQTADDNGRAYVEIQDTDGTFHDPVRSGWGLSVNRPHSIVAWLTPAGQVTIWEGWASEPRPLGDPVPGSEWALGPVTGAGEATPGRAGPSCQESSCTVIVTEKGATWQPWEVSDAGTSQLTDGGYLLVNDVNDAGLTVGLTRITDTGSCSKLLGGGEFQGFATCKDTLQSFSPDGQLILGLPAYPDGAGSNQIAMFDLDGNRLFSRASTPEVQPTYNAQEWEDDTHVLVPVYQDGMWSLVRVSSDGSMEYAVAPQAGAADVTVSLYVIPTGGAVPTS